MVCEISFLLSWDEFGLQANEKVNLITLSAFHTSNNPFEVRNRDYTFEIQPPLFNLSPLVICSNSASYFTLTFDYLVIALNLYLFILVI